MCSSRTESVPVSLVQCSETRRSSWPRRRSVADVPRSALPNLLPLRLVQAPDGLPRRPGRRRPSAFAALSPGRLPVQERLQVGRPDPDRVHGPEMGQLAAITEPVDGRVAHAQAVRDLGDLEQPIAPP
jgi:hypothetical protein